MNTERRALRFLAALFFAACAFFAAGIGVKSARAETGGPTDITETGVDFIASAPQAETEYKAGKGTLVYIPAEDGGAAQIVLENAEIFSGAKVNYSPGNSTYAALAAKGDAELVLKGENKIYMRPSGSNTALLFYDSNVTVRGEGSLSIGYREGASANINAHPAEIMGNYATDTADEAFAESGNFTLESGALTINGVGSIGQGSLTVSNRIAVCGGRLQTYGQMAGVYSVYGDIELSGGVIRAENFNEYGLYARRGDVTVGGSADVFFSSSVRPSSVGISGGDMGNGRPETQSGGNVYFQGGTTEINVRFIGVFAQHVSSDPGGQIEITGGSVDVTVPESTQNVAAALYAQGDEGDILLKGGSVRAVSGGGNAQASIGVYADRYLKIEGGELYAGGTNTNGSSFGANADDGIYVTGGTFVACGGTAAVDGTAPYGGRGVSITAATDVAGENIVGYDPQNFHSYKYLKFESGRILSVTVAPSSAEAERGQTLQFTAEVKGTGTFDTSVLWNVTGAESAATKIDENGQLTVAADETAATLTVTAVSVADGGKNAAATVRVTAAGGQGEQPSEPEGGLPAGAIVAITAGSVAGAAAIAAAICFAVRKRKQ